VTRRFAVLTVLMVAPALALMLLGLREPLHGEHVFRQTHVTANIEKFLAHGLSLRPETYNQDVPAALFEFPLYTWLVTCICRIVGSAPVPTARLTNVIIFILTLYTLNVLWRRSGARRTQRFFGLAVFAYAPLDLFYFQVPLPDPLALLLALCSLLAYLSWDEAQPGRARTRAFAAWIASALLSALIKNPLYLPYAVAIVWHRWRRRGLRTLMAPAFLAFVVALAAVVVGFKLYSNHVNSIGAFLDPAESVAYFGALGDRLRPRFWRLLAAAFTTHAAVPVTLGLAALGVVLYVLRGRNRARALHLGLCIGSALTLLVFFNRHHEHPYYQMPFEPVLSFFAAFVPAQAEVWLRWRTQRHWARVWLVRFASAALVAVLGLQGVTHLTTMSKHWDVGLADRGAFLAGSTDPDDFVVYVLGRRADNWEPSYLYFARRDGYNLVRSHLTYARLAELQRKFAPTHRCFLVFSPAAWVDDVNERLLALGARVVANDDELGRLYRLDPAWLRPPR
jgi:hypothetical protein